MSLASHLIHRAIVQRQAESQTDGYGLAQPDWRDVGEIACRLVEKEETVVQSVMAASAVQSTYLLLTAPEADVQERDRIRQATMEDGSVVDAVFVVRFVHTRRGRAAQHKTAFLEAVA